MSTYTIIVDPEYILACKEFVPQKDAKGRNYLLGLRVELNKEDAFLIATDGHVLVAYHHNEGHNDPDQGRLDFTVPKELLTGLKPRGSVAITMDDDLKTCTLSQQGASRSANFIADRYPDWRRVIPGQVTGEVALYDPALMVGIAKAAKHLGSSSCYVTPNGDSGGHVTFGREEIFGIVMPMRGPLVRSFPEWCRE